MIVPRSPGRVGSGLARYQGAWSGGKREGFGELRLRRPAVTLYPMRHLCHSTYYATPCLTSASLDYQTFLSLVTIGVLKLEEEEGAMYEGEWLDDRYM